QHFGDRCLKARAEVCDIAPPEAALPCHQRVAGADDGRLQPREREIAILAVDQGPGKCEAAGVAGRRGALDLRPAGKAEPECAGDLVERLARRIIYRAAQPAIAAEALDGEELAMPTRDEQEQVGPRQPV